MNEKTQVQWDAEIPEDARKMEMADEILATLKNLVEAIEDARDINEFVFGPKRRILDRAQEVIEKAWNGG